jgi:RNA-binding protein
MSSISTLLTMSQRITQKSKKEKGKAPAIKLAPSMWIGKNGVNDSTVHELQRQLKMNKLVKVRILRSALALSMSRHDIAAQLERLSSAPLVELKGYTAVYRSPYRIRKQVASTYQRK